MEPKADIGLIGLAVMGQNLVLNMDDHGYTVAVFNRTTSKVDNFINGNAKGTKVIGTQSIEELVATLKSPRRIMLMVKAGEAIDKFIDLLLPHLDQGDIIIDGGNSNFHDTIRRAKFIESKGLNFIGTNPFEPLRWVTPAGGDLFTVLGGTQVAREAADIVLTDDAFATTASAYFPWM